MEISLRKANALQLALNDALKGMSFPKSVSITEFEDPEFKIAEATAEFYTSMEKRKGVVDAIYAIRSCVDKANHAHGISEKLSQVAKLERDVQFFTDLAGSKVRQSSEVLQGKIEKMRAQTGEHSYYRESSIDTTIFMKEQIAIFKENAADAKRQKQKLQDDLLELNVRTTISLSEQTVSTLKSVGLV